MDAVARTKTMSRRRVKSRTSVDDEGAAPKIRDDAAVGSISHILRTLFRGLYDDETKEKEAARLAAEADETARKRRRGKKSDDAAAAAADAPEAGGDDDDDAPAASSSSPEAADDEEAEDGEAVLELEETPWFDARNLKDVAGPRRKNAFEMLSGRPRGARS